MPRGRLCRRCRPALSVGALAAPVALPATVLELLDMKRPFPALKALDMEDVAKDVLAAMK